MVTDITNKNHVFQNVICHTRQLTKPNKSQVRNHPEAFCYDWSIK